MPAGVSTMRGGGWPSRSVRNRPLTATPPSDARSTACGVLDAVAEAARRRDERVLQVQRAELNGQVSHRLMCHAAERVPDDGRRVEHRAVEAGADEVAAGAAAGRARRSCSSRPCRSPSPARARRTPAVPARAPSVGDGAHHRRRAAGVERDGVGRAGASASARSSGAVTRPRSPRAAVLGREHEPSRRAVRRDSA